MRFLKTVALLFFVLPVAISNSAAAAQEAAAASSSLDSDHDGLTDDIENALLAQFAPRFNVSADDCAGRPAAFVPFNANPAVKDEDGTIYGQAFPLPGNSAEVELHYYHLWQSDCGEMSHNRDAEHVSVLVQRVESSEWKALYWYAAAHEDTVCESSQIARAASIDGELHGAHVWVSRGKHASFLSEAICRGGCGSDECTEMEPLQPSAVVNLGELTAPMNGAIWASSPAWPLAQKMGRSDFTDVRIARLDAPASEGIVWAKSNNRKMKAVIRSSSNVVDGASTGMAATDAALSTADVHTSNALDNATKSTSGSLEKSYRSVKNALGVSARKVGKALEQK